MINSTNSTVYYDGSVFLDDDGKTITSAISIDLTLLVLKIVLCVIGVPLNTVAILVTLCRQCAQTCRPRNIFLLASFFSNLTIFIPALLEIAYYFHPTNDWICLAFVATAGLSELFLLQSTLLSLIDRYLAIQYPLWHWNKVTVTWAAFWIILSFILAVLISKFVYIFGIHELGCHVHFVSNRILGTFAAILFALCIIGRVIVFIQTRTLLKNNATIQDRETIELQDLNNGGLQQAVGDENNRSNNVPLIIVLRRTRMDPETLRRLEDGATKTMVAGVTSLFAFTFPRLVFYLILNICKLNRLEYCSRDMLRAVPYLKQLGLAYAIYHPVIHLYWNRKLTASGDQQQHQVEGTGKRNNIYD